MQHSISATKKGGSVVNQIAAALVERIVRAAKQDTNFRVVVVIPEVPGFAATLNQRARSRPSWALSTAPLTEVEAVSMKRFAKLVSSRKSSNIKYLTMLMCGY